MLVDDNMNRAELAALSAITESMKAVSTAMDAQTKELKSLASKVDDVQVRVIRLEEARHGRDIDRLIKSDEEIKTRLAALELSNASMNGKFAGANTFATWLHKLVPWFAPLVVAVYLVMEAKGTK